MSGMPPSNYNPINMPGMQQPPQPNMGPAFSIPENNMNMPNEEIP
jgi:hypothetical protein